MHLVFCSDNRYEQTSKNLTVVDAVCPDQLPSIIKTTLTKYGLTRAQVGVYAHSAVANITFVNYGGGLYYTPASNTKLLMATGTVLTRNMDDHIRTPVFAETAGNGDLKQVCVQGMFDPSIVDSQLTTLAQQISASSSVIDELVLDAATESIDYPGVDDTWAVGDLSEDYGAAASIFGMWTFLSLRSDFCSFKPQYCTIESVS